MKNDNLSRLSSGDTDQIASDTEEHHDFDNEVTFEDDSFIIINSGDIVIKDNGRKTVDIQTE